MVWCVVFCVAAFAAPVATSPSFIIFGRYRAPSGMQCTEETSPKPFRVECTPLSSTISPIVTCPSFGDLPMTLSEGVWWVPVSNATTLLTVTKNSGTLRWPVPVARSYGGLPWEVSLPTAPGQTPVTLGGCSGSCCQLVLPAAGQFTFRLDAPVPDGTDGALPQWRVERVVTKLLIQATFGPTAASVGALVDDVLQMPPPEGSAAAAWWPDLSGWLQTQMAMRPSLHRAHLRRRQNVRFRPFAQQAGDGEMVGACEIGARWSPFMFTADDRGRTLRVETRVVAGNTTHVVMVGASGTARGELSDVSAYFERPQDAAAFVVGTTYHVCLVTERVLGQVQISASSECSGRLYFRNPAITFPHLDPVVESGSADVEVMAVNPGEVMWNTLRPDLGWNQEVRFIRQLQVPCTLSAATQRSGTALLREGTGAAATWYRFDCRRWLADASFGIDDGSGGMWNMTRSTVVGEGMVARTPAAAGVPACPTVPKTFLNAHACVRTAGCSPIVYRSAPLTLNTTTLQRFYTEGGLYVYAIQNLRLEDEFRKSPCPSPSDPATSRWQRIGTGSCASPSSLDSTTRQMLADAITSSDDASANPSGRLRDIVIPTSAAGECRTSGAIYGARVDVSGACWEHVHPHEGNVYDASLWTTAHPGNSDLYNPIRRIAESGGTTLSYPSSHSMSRWLYQEPTMFTLLGRFGTTVDFARLPDSVRTARLGEAFGATVNTTGTEAELCPSPGEVSNAPADGAMYARPTSKVDDSTDETDYVRYPESERSNVHSALAMWAPDQLRQRVAWALSQIYVIGDATGYSELEAELHTAYYDIFVRHAFGNLRDILQEVSYSPMMGRYLTYYGNRAYAASKTPPDENYAREVMQLFSIGLYMLEQDGAQTVNTAGKPIPTYDSDDILTLARAWTGFVAQAPRGSLTWASGGNMVDPMQINPLWRDPFPKTDLFDGYLGDGLPRCRDLPPRAFLRTGATWRSLGGTPQPQTVDAPGRLYPLSPNISGGWLQPVSPSGLYQALCAPNGGQCTFPSHVTLTSNLVCNGQECLLGKGHPRVVRVVDASRNTVVFYEYLPRPCVGLAYTQLRSVMASHSTRSYRERLCEDPAAAVGGAACCDSSNTTIFPVCPILTERMSYDEAAQRCATAGMHVCPTPAHDRPRTASDCFDDREFTWIETSCTMKAQVTDVGAVTLIHVNGDYVPSHLEQDSGNVFRVRWTRRNLTHAMYTSGAAPSDADGRYPTVANRNCSAVLRADGSARPTATPVCTVSGVACVCDVEMAEEAVYTDATHMPSAPEIEDALRIGAAPVDVFDAGEFTEGATVGGVTVFTAAASGGAWDASTVFRVAVNSTAGGAEYRWLLNVQAVVRIVGSTWTFRNPPVFNDLNLMPDVSRRLTAHQETSALLDHLFWHPNTATFVSRLLIQRLGLSNPSPRYVRAVVEAFRTGTYTGYTPELAQGTTAASAAAPQYPLSFSGKYGDLGATVAAIILDPEARMLAMEGDFAFGQVREPLVKLIHYLRALEYTPELAPTLNFMFLGKKIGQGPYESPTVFNFFLPDFAPSGAVGDSGLVSPESMLGTEPLTVNFLNGIASLVKQGLCSRDGGFGSHWSPGIGALGYSSSAPSNATVAAKAAATIDDFDLLLTGRRMDPSTRDTLTAVYNASAVAKDDAHALRDVEKLMAAVAEFHTTAPRSPRPVERQLPASSGMYSGRPYKAVVVLYMNGGCDSWNLLMPHSGCPDANRLATEYTTTRSNVAVSPSSMLQINVSPGTQPCATMGIHPSLSVLKQLYDDGDAAFVANVGPLVEPVTKEEYRFQSKRLPASLYSHNSQSELAHSMETEETIGVLGGMIEAVSAPGSAEFRSAAYSLAGKQKIFKGASQVRTLDAAGLPTFNEPELISTIENLTRNESGSVFAEQTNNVIAFTLASSESMKAGLASVNITTSFPTGGLGEQFEQISKVIAARVSMQAERSVFFVEIGGFDMHSDVVGPLSEKFATINAALGAFATEMKAQNTWDSVVVASSSEFGRTWFSNGKGTDHGWGGNHFLLGGSIRGGRIHGQFPTSMAEDSDVNVGGMKGRVLPTSPWEAMWAPISDWFGVSAAQMTAYLPNLPNFPSSMIPQRNAVFEN
eukprot:TRINITY_DN472_c1_g1_i4.p1 TRINITY_DN472_c1_g1~~TRINITY_DN472_c1_g1_i4.p1  ORF type:complete len:2117 (+),score=436.19 TRINITY_DN472_c1_g1_i4:276-6626(+)